MSWSNCSRSICITENIFLSVYMDVLSAMNQAMQQTYIKLSARWSL
jgi:hypothetical protein